MPLYAVDDLDDALAATKARLLPLDWGTWLRLALLSLFVAGNAGGSGGGQAGAAGAGSGGAVPSAASAAAVPLRLAALVAAVVVLALLVGLLATLLGSVFEFVFLDALRSDEVAVLAGLGEHFGRGLRLFAFHVVLGLVVLGPVAVVLALAVLPAMGSAPGALVFALVAVAPLVFLVAFAAAVASLLTVRFVAPVMLRFDCGVVAGWRRLWPTFADDWVQFLAYVLVELVALVVAGFLVGGVAVVAAILLAVPFGVVFLLPYLVAAGAATLAWLVLGGALFVVALVVVLALAQVPVQTYLRYLALFVLGDLNPDLDLIPDRRAAVRADEARAGGEGGEAGE
ncbi:MAG: hypothetical protein ABEJ04_01990 [Halobacteriaceae archaeon]